MPSKTFYKYAHLYLTLGLVVVLLGFSTTYFSRLSDFSLPYHVHGISATLWMILLILQQLVYIMPLNLLNPSRPNTMKIINKISSRQQNYY